MVGPLTLRRKHDTADCSVTAFVVATTLMQHPVTGAKPGTARPTIVDLGTLGGGFSDAYGINNDPDDIQVVGHSTRADGFAHGFFWTAATRMIDLGSLGRSSYARDINNHGMIAGAQRGCRRVWELGHRLDDVFRRLDN